MLPDPLRPKPEKPSGPSTGKFTLVANKVLYEKPRGYNSFYLLPPIHSPLSPFNCLVPSAVCAQSVTTRSLFI